MWQFAEWRFRFTVCEFESLPSCIGNTTWCKKRDSKRYTRHSSFDLWRTRKRGRCIQRFRSTNVTSPAYTTKMVELDRLPAPRMDWNSSDAPQALKKFKALRELYFSGPLIKKDEGDQISYLLIWSGEEGIVYCVFIGSIKFAWSFFHIWKVLAI